MRYLVLSLTLCGGIMGAPTPLGAQVAQRSTITGTVTDASTAPLSGCTVTLAGTQLIGGVRTITTDRSGRYSFSGLLPGIYEVTASAPGMQTARQGNVPLPVETTYDVNFALEIAHVVQAVEVQSTSAPIDVHRASSPTVFPETVLHDLPTARSLASFLSLTPGVTTTPSANGIVGEVAYGGTQGSNGFSVDGVSLVESSLGTGWTHVNFNWLQQVQVVALGASAEYGGFTGAVANGVLRSGSNRVSGLGEWLQIPANWSSGNIVNYPSGRDWFMDDRRILTWWDVNGQAGAPVVKDRLWAFGGINTFHHEYRSFGYQGPMTTTERTSRALVKLDAAPGRSVMLQGFVTSDRDDAIGANLSQYNPTLESQADTSARTHAWNARSTWTHGSSLLVELRASGTLGTVRGEPHAPATPNGPSPEWDVDSSTWCCNSVLSREHRRTPTIAAAISVFRNSPLGSHEFRAGLEREHAQVESDSGVPTGRTLTISRGQVVHIDEWAGDHLRSTTDRFSVFVQDRWALSRRVTLEPGLRVDLNSGSLPSRPDVIGTRGIGPRIGVAWDVTGRQSSVVRAHYGRYFDPLFGNVFESFDPTASGARVSYDVTADGLVETYRSPNTAPQAIQQNLKQSYVDQWVLGGERSLWAHTTVTLQYVGRRFGDFIGYINRRESWTPYTLMDPGPDGVAATADDGGPVVVYRRDPGSDPDVVVTNPPDAYRHYGGLQLILTRRFAARWQSHVSWAWSRSSGTIDNLYFRNASGVGPPLGTEFGFLLPGTMVPGRPTFDFSEFKADGSYRAPWLGGFTTAAIFRWHSGARWNRIVVNTEPFFLLYSPEPPGARRTPSLGSLDIRVEKTFRLPGPLRVGAYVDVFNATNVERPIGFGPVSGPNFGRPGVGRIREQPALV